MAIETKKKLDWTDIQNIYNSLNQARTKFSMSQVTVPEKEKKRPIPTDATNLEAEIVAMKTNKYLSNLNIPDVRDPQTKERIKPDIFNQMRANIDNILGTCPHDSSYNGSGYNGSFGGGGEDFSCYPRFDSARCDSNFGWRPGNPETNFGSRWSSCRPFD